jgi:putative ABC transport system ATP-binding protein
MIEIKNLTKTYLDGEIETKVLKGIDFHAEEKDFIAIMGRSGAGKSTFLYQMSMLDDPTGGEIIIDGTNVIGLASEKRSRFRLKHLGYVFQDYALLPDLTAIENVALPLLMKGEKKSLAYKHAKDMLEKVGLGHRLSNVPANLSGGEQQRVSVARAIVHKPKILFADEPTANLDNFSSRQIMEIFQELNKGGQTIIMVTHEEEYAKMAKRIVHLDDGKIVDEHKNK